VTLQQEFISASLSPGPCSFTTVLYSLHKKEFILAPKIIHSQAQEKKEKEEQRWDENS
jgi:hypothetical protein